MFRRRSAPAPADRTGLRTTRRDTSSRTGGNHTTSRNSGTNGGTTQRNGTSADHAGGKGRPTPKRREAERERRKRVRTPRDRKDAYRQARARAREERVRMRRALTTGDERNLPPRDAGPVKSFARDYVDCRRRGGELFLPGAIIVFGLTFFPDPRVQFYGTLLWFLVILLVIADSFRVARGVKREVARRFPRESNQGLAMYVVLRSLQIRRFRLPPPKVKPGTKI